MARQRPSLFPLNSDAPHMLRVLSSSPGSCAAFACSSSRTAMPEGQCNTLFPTDSQLSSVSRSTSVINHSTSSTASGPRAYTLLIRLLTRVEHRRAKNSRIAVAGRQR
jgi:hypothetical protein